MLLFWIIPACIFIGTILPYIAHMVVQYMFRASDSETKLREEYNALRKELRNISAVDEFAKFARTQRKLNKVKEQLTDVGLSRTEDGESVKWKLAKTIQAINGAVLLYIAYQYRFTPVLYNVPYWFWPINILLSYPTGVSGALSTVGWFCVCNTALSTFAAFAETEATQTSLV